MSKLSAARVTLLQAAVGALLILAATPGARAQQGSTTQGGGYSGDAVESRPRGRPIMSLSDIWGPAKMPPAPTDFGPHFDFPPAPLNSTPLHDPYPN